MDVYQLINLQVYILFTYGKARVFEIPVENLKSMSNKFWGYIYFNLFSGHVNVKWLTRYVQR